MQHEVLREIVAYTEEPLNLPMLEGRIKTGTMVLARCVEAALKFVDAETPVPTLDQLWDSSPAFSRDTMNREAQEYLLSRLPDEIQAAYLVAKRKRPAFNPAMRDTLVRYLRPWIDDSQVALEFYRQKDDPKWIYPESYKSPRQYQLEAIVRDSTLPDSARLDAHEQLAKIEEYKLRISPALEGREGANIIHWSAVDRARRKRTCRKHDQRNCSQCTRRRRDRRDLKARYNVLAEAAGVDPTTLMLPFKPGRQSKDEALRGRVLGGVVTALARDGFTQEAIGAHIDRSQERIAQMILAATNYL